MRNEIIGSIFFILLILGLLIGMLFDRVELFGFLGLMLGLGVVLLFRKKYF
ncbi:hypothetical protein M3210_08860 [Oceanobacillus luteolus]|uniref:Uncharacterized protein n=1 Tax=Oceanobacillus luteolus TaxID=1274358 RepID=A0ABW4HQR0_9BACI|nr:hypothetical protein [Oceanobacillus luteolus]MCM3740379.1 hypothetical protein [Oceanobacillus luteolus]